MPVTLPRMRSHFSVLEVATMLHKSRWPVWRAITRGDIAAVKIGGAWLIPRSEVERLLR